MPSSLASHLASSMGFTPICPPSGATNRTSRARILSLTLGSCAIDRPPVSIAALSPKRRQRSCRLHDQTAAVRFAYLGSSSGEQDGRVGGSASACALGCTAGGYRRGETESMSDDDARDPGRIAGVPSKGDLRELTHGGAATSVPPRRWYGSLALPLKLPGRAEHAAMPRQRFLASMVAETT